MKIVALVFLALCGTAVASDSKSSFGLSGVTKIIEAGVWSDGGSVNVTLLDEHGIKRQVWYMNNWLHSENEHGGQLVIHPVDEKADFLPKNGSSEKELLALLRAACLATFGTSDPQKLREVAHAPARNQQSGPPAISEMIDTSINQMPYAMSSLFRQIENRDKPKPK